MKQLVILIGAIAVVVFAFFQLRGCSTAHQVRTSSIVQEYPMTCSSCRKSSTMTLDQMMTFRRKGQYESPAYEMARFPCPLCGKITCVVDDHHGDAQKK